MRLRLASAAGIIAWVSASSLARADLPPPPLFEDVNDPPLYGYKDGLLYLRDPHDLIRLYPHGQVDLDAHGYFGAGVDSVSASDAGVNLAPRFFVRHARFDLAGELWKRVAFDGGIELVANPAIDGSRVDGRSTEVALADAWAKLDAGRGLGLWFGVFQAPFSQENRTDAAQLAMMERNMAVRGFIAPGGGKALGAAISGSMPHQVLHWDVGAFGAETLSPTDFEQHFDGIGRLAAMPLEGHPDHPLHDLEFGASVRAGSRNARDQLGDAPAITTGQGFALWRPTYVDSLGRSVHVIPDSLQWGTGVDVRVPIQGFIVRGEVFYMSKDMREAFAGASPVTDTLREGRLSGLAWYAELSCWPLQMAKLVPALPLPRTDPQADHLEVAITAPVAERRGFELAVLGGGIDASYDSAARGGAPDPTQRSSIELYQVGAALSYWQSNHLRLTFDGNAYISPDSSGTDGSSLVVPGNLGVRPADASAHTLWELGGRASVMF